MIKILSVDPTHYADAPTEAIRQVLQSYTGQAIARDALLDLKDVGMGSLSHRRRQEADMVHYRMDTNGHDSRD